jgi:hypothetical protein
MGLLTDRAFHVHWSAMLPIYAAPPIPGPKLLRPRALALVTASPLAVLLLCFAGSGVAWAAPDSDGDGMADNLDACPHEPEDRDGFQEEDGCPDMDNDGDGVIDAADQCPRDPEDMDGFADNDGCPDPDNDGDAVLDIADLCPNDPENLNGFQDQDGCPDSPQ